MNREAPDWRTLKAAHIFPLSLPSIFTQLGFGNIIQDGRELQAKYSPLPQIPYFMPPAVTPMTPAVLVTRSSGGTMSKLLSSICVVQAKFCSISISPHVQTLMREIREGRRAAQLMETELFGRPYGYDNELGAGSIPSQINELIQRNFSRVEEVDGREEQSRRSS
ncbi:hypothetical protein TEQG_04087 [Trichophyton equinum CBS 127.97]|uniref:HNH nuclease domain-containing protein n=1 Tax=Trichophyton equinum (strain ATCC MYA-4606 / CBS 127.97) TaxID=559882 RepID=F2PT51_TRIEC|nr:hypothetical protein TEQG_04087 [Trichophyton equinum CBS 127.97]